MREFFQRLFSDPATVRKFIAAFIGAVGVAISVGLLDAKYSNWVAVVVAFLSTIGVYKVPNKPDSEPTSP